MKNREEHSEPKFDCIYSEERFGVWLRKVPPHDHDLQTDESAWFQALTLQSGLHERCSLRSQVVLEYLAADGRFVLGLEQSGCRHRMESPVLGSPEGLSKGQAHGTRMTEAVAEVQVQGPAEEARRTGQTDLLPLQRLQPQHQGQPIATAGASPAP